MHGCKRFCYTHSLRKPCRIYFSLVYSHTPLSVVLTSVRDVMYTELFAWFALNMANLCSSPIQQNRNRIEQSK